MARLLRIAVALLASPLCIVLDFGAVFAETTRGQCFSVRLLLLEVWEWALPQRGDQ